MGASRVVLASAVGLVAPTRSTDVVVGEVMGACNISALSFEDSCF